MIKSITLKNWKSFGEATLYVDPLTVLIGTNASGKSNFLDALVFLREFILGDSVDKALQGDDSYDAGVRGGKDLVIKKGESKTYLSIIFQAKDEEDFFFEFKYDLEIGKGSSGEYEALKESLYQLHGGVASHLFTFKDVPRSFTELEISSWAKDAGKSQEEERAIWLARNELTMNFDYLQFLDPIPQNMRSYSKVSRFLKSDGSNIAGYLANGQEHLVSVAEELSKAIKNLPESEIRKVWSERVGLLKSDAMLYCEEQWPGESEPVLIDAGSLSDGTLRIIAILTAILAAEEGSTLVIEEIDNGLHPSRANLLVDLLHKYSAEREVDIICTTHNPALLDAFGLEMLPYISLVYRDAKDGSSKIRALNEIEHFERIVTKGTLGDLITQGRFEAALKPS